MTDQTPSNCSHWTSEVLSERQEALSMLKHSSKCRTAVQSRHAGYICDIYKLFLFLRPFLLLFAINSEAIFLPLSSPTHMHASNRIRTTDHNSNEVNPARVLHSAATVTSSTWNPFTVISFGNVMGDFMEHSSTGCQRPKPISFQDTNLNTFIFTFCRRSCDTSSK